MHNYNLHNLMLHTRTRITIRDWPGIFHGTERNRTISRNFLGINYGMEHFLVHLIYCLEHPDMCGTFTAILTMSINEIPAQMLFRVSAKLLNTAKNHC